MGLTLLLKRWAHPSAVQDFVHKQVDEELEKYDAWLEEKQEKRQSKRE
jgi:hypothetical protein